MRVGATDFRTEQPGSIIVIDNTASGLVKETRGSSTASSNRTCFDGRSGKNKCNNGTPESVGRVCTSARPICYKSGQGK